jgi:superfamily I DNA/RNA helicase
MAASPTRTPFPGPAALGRNVIVGPGAPAPDGFTADAPRLVVDDDVLAHPGPAVAYLHGRWSRRQPTVVELVADNAALQRPEVDNRAPWDLPRGFTFLRERLAFLVWANSWDARDAQRGPVWWDAELAVRGGAQPGDGSSHDVVVDGATAWCDGGPRGPVPGLSDSAGLLHRETIRLHRRDAGRFPLRLLGTTSPTDDLAADQLDAVTHAAGPARVIAPAGSGKTRVLTARLRHLLRDRHIEPSLVTAVAYNTRAAQEMRDRLVDPTTGAGVRANVRTLHSLGWWICRLAEGDRQLLDEREQRAILDRLVRTAKIPNQDPFQPYLDALGEVRLGLRHPDAVGAEYELDDFDETFRRYRDELTRRGATDFDEQVFHAIELLLADPDLRTHVQQVGTHLLVDEFQDLTPAFHLLVRLVASPSLQVFGVGDDDQVIYGYAGANPGYLIDYAAEFPGATPHPLEVNYRCPPEVVGQVARVLTHNRRRVDKVIRAGRTGPAPTTAADRWDAGVVVHGVDAGAMAARTVATIEDRIAAGAAPGDVAVLARVNATLLPVQVALGEAGIPRTAPLDATVIGRTGVRTALAYLRLALDPERMRREDVFDTLNRPSRKVKSAVAELLRGQRFSMDQLRGLEEVLSTTHAERWRGYLDDVQLLSDAITDGADAERLLWLVRHRVGLGEAMDTLDSARSRPEGSSHGDDLDALAQLAALHPDPVTFREWLVEALRRPGDDDGVVLSTVHRVKGMEWDHVVVFAANHGLMPHRLAEDDEEERRVFHVAVTRCRETVTVVADRTATSPFVDELRHDPPDRRPTSRRDGPSTDTSRPPRTGADGVPVVAAVPGRTLTAPGGVAATVVRTELAGTRRGVVVEVDAAWAPLALDAPVEVDGHPARLELQATRVAPPAARAGAAGSGRLLDTGDDRLDGEDAIRFEALRAWRTGQAREQQVPPYIVFNDTHLREIARRAPDSLVALSRCPGVGPSKLERYGDDVLQVIADVDAG